MLNFNMGPNIISYFNYFVMIMMFTLDPTTGFKLYPLNILQCRFRTYNNVHIFN